MKKIIFVLSVLVVQSFAGTGDCVCPWDKKENDHRCGEGSQFCLEGGEEPDCHLETGETYEKAIERMCPTRAANIQFAEALKKHRMDRKK